MAKGGVEFTGDLSMKNGLTDEDWRFVQGLALARPIGELAQELGWTEEKGRRKARSAVILAAVAAEGLQRIHGIYIPRALDVINGLMDSSTIVRNVAKDGNITESVVPVPPTVRLAAAQTILKIARLEEHRPPHVQDETDLEDATPDRLRQLLGVIEAKLGDLATPVNAQDDAPDAEIAQELPNDYSVL